jgi:hypothetical protein
MGEDEIRIPDYQKGMDIDRDIYNIAMRDEIPLSSNNLNFMIRGYQKAIREIKRDDRRND